MYSPLFFVSKLENYKSQNYIFMLQKIFNKVAHNVSKTVMIAIIAMCVTNIANAQIRVAVLDFQAGAGISQNDVNGISDVLITYLGNDARFILVERTQVQRVLREQGFQHSNITDSDAVRLGRYMNVNKVVLGRVNVVGGQQNIDCRVVNVETGRIVATAGNSWTPQTFRSVLRGVAQNLSAGMIRFEQARVVEQGQVVEQRPIESHRPVENHRPAENQREGVVINGVRWARFNVGNSGTFVPREEYFGNLFTWYQAQNACPQGWRLPTENELRSLVNVGSQWIWRGNVNGRLFGTAPNQIFLPTAGWRSDNTGGFYNIGEVGMYWSSTRSGSSAQCLWFGDEIGTGYNDPQRSLSVRCVAR